MRIKTGYDPFNGHTTGKYLVYSPSGPVLCTQCNNSKLRGGMWQYVFATSDKPPERGAFRGVFCNVYCLNLYYTGGHHNE